MCDLPPPGITRFLVTDSVAMLSPVFVCVFSIACWVQQSLRSSTFIGDVRLRLLSSFAFSHASSLCSVYFFAARRKSMKNARWAQGSNLKPTQSGVDVTHLGPLGGGGSVLTWKLQALVAVSVFHLKQKFVFFCGRNIDYTINSAHNLKNIVRTASTVQENGMSPPRLSDTLVSIEAGKG